MFWSEKTYKMKRSTSIKAFSFAFIFFAIHFDSTVRAKKVSVCYYRNWAQYYAGRARFLPEDIDPHLCSVISYASMQVDLYTHKMKGRQKNDDEMLRRISSLKKKNPDLKVFVSVGGWNHEKLPRFSRMVARRSTRKIFIQSVLHYLTSRRLDGINIDWEYPTFRGSSPRDKRKFTYLLREMFYKFYYLGQQRNRNRFFITLSVSGSPKKISRSYEVKRISKYVDWVDVMAYNLRGPWRKHTGCPTLIKGKEPTVLGAVSMWLNNGMPASKINLGMTTYGRTFLLKDPKLHRVGDPSIGKGGRPGVSTKTRGILSYYEICTTRWKFRKAGKESSCGVPYASFRRQWVAYDDVQSIEEKVDLLVNSLGLNGVSFWALDFDDFTGSNCGQGKYPLLTAALRTMKRPRDHRSKKTKDMYDGSSIRHNV